MQSGGDVRLSRIGEVLRRYGKKRSTLYREIREGRFPKPVRIGVKQSAWHEDALLAWEKGVTEGSRGGGGQ